MLKERVNQEFITAFKAKNVFRKDTLGILKSKITEQEKKKNNQELTNEEIYSVISTMIKQREQSIAIYNQNDSEQAKINSQKESDEILILKEFMPEQLSDEKLAEIIQNVIDANLVNSKPMMALVMQELNANYKGKFDSKKVKNIVDEKMNF